MAYTNVWTVTAPLDTQAANQGAVDFRATKLDVMQRIASFGAGLLADRPTPETTSGTADWTGVTYLATDTNQLFRWSGTAWVDISTSTPGSVAVALATTTNPVNVSLAVAPTANQILTATDATHATWQAPAPAAKLATSGSPVVISAAAPPSAGQVLTALGATTADWQSASAGDTVSLTPSGFCNFGNGLILQWDSAAFPDVPTGNPGYTASIVFPEAFPNACFHVIFGFETTSPDLNNWQAALTSVSTTGFDLQIQEWSVGVNPGTIHYLAIGF